LSVAKFLQDDGVTGGFKAREYVVEKTHGICFLRAPAPLR
jgi:hypothetical protein